MSLWFVCTLASIHRSSRCFSSLGRYPFKMQDTSGGRTTETKGDQERWWCHLGTSRAKSNTPSPGYPAWWNSGLTAYFLPLPTSHGEGAALWFLCRLPMMFHSSDSFVQVLFKVNHLSVAFVLLIKSMCHFDPFSLPYAICLLVPYILQRCRKKKRKLKYLFFLLPSLPPALWCEPPVFTFTQKYTFKGSFILVGF